MCVEYVIVNDKDSDIGIVEVIILLSLAVVILNSSVKDKLWLLVRRYLTFFHFFLMLI